MAFPNNTTFTKWLLGGIATVLLWVPLHAQQQQVRVRASLEEKQIAKGVYTYLTVLIEGGQPENIPEVIQVDGLEIVRKVYSPRMTSINGVLKTEVTVMYGVVGRTPGKYEIPSLSFVINGIPHLTEAQSLEIVEMAGDQELSAERPYFLTFKAAKTEAYVNELVPIELHLFVRGSGTIGSAGRPKFENGEKFVIKPFPHQYHVELKQIDGIPFTSVRFPTRIAALSAGSHKLGPASTEANVTRPMNTLFPRNFLQFSEPRTITSQELDFTIKPLPEVGRPASFQNTVGRFEMKVEASPTDLRVGDPIFIDIQVKGK
ncbi:MAG: BatD family protein, partial [Verrucomicrobiota bacterium]